MHEDGQVMLILIFFFKKKYTYTVLHIFIDFSLIRELLRVVNFYLMAVVIIGVYVVVVFSGMFAVVPFIILSVVQNICLTDV